MSDDSSPDMTTQHAAAARVAVVGICMSASVMLCNALLIFGLALLESITEYRLGAISLCMICAMLVIGGCLFAWLCLWGPFHRVK
jgi:hypothetical protein